jgi:hypothetical protein
MKGYFSRIASQSGLRLTEQGDKARRAGELSAAPPLPLAPLDHDEVVMVPPAMPPSETAVKPSPPKFEAPRVTEAGRETVAADPVADKPVGTAKPAGDLLRGKETVDQARDAKDPEPLDTPVIRAGVQEMTSLSEPVTQEVVMTGPAAELPAETVAESAAAAEKPAAQYFMRTTEALERGDMNPLELNEIILREAAEWAAAGAEPGAEAERLQEIVEINQVNEVAEIVVQEHQPPRIAARRIGAARPEEGEALPEIASNAPPPEQNFDLSIGSITVVIEDDAKPAPVKVQEQRPSQPGRTGGGGQADSGRFSRRYL